MVRFLAMAWRENPKLYQIAKEDLSFVRYAVDRSAYGQNLLAANQESEES